MTNKHPRSASKAATQHALAQSGKDDQAHALLLMAILGERGDMVLVDMLSRFARVPRPAPCEPVELDFHLFAQIKRACDESERMHWASLLVGAAVRGDELGLFLLERILKLRLADRASVHMEAGKLNSSLRGTQAPDARCVAGRSGL